MSLARDERSSVPGEVTQLLLAIQDGDESARHRLIAVLYKELHRIATSYIRRERSDHTLQPTALVHEAYLQLIDQKGVSWQDRTHFIATAAQVMRRILVDHARSRNAAKRGGPRYRTTLTGNIAQVPGQDIDVLALDEALDRLAEADDRQARIVEFHFFGGLTFDEIALLLKVSERTVKREWRFAKAWLHSELFPGMPAPEQHS